MSKHHQSHRRRSYGRRQHELHERPIEPADARRLDLDDSDQDDRGRGAAHFDLDVAARPMRFSVSD